MDLTAADLVYLGTISRPQGHRGAVRLFPAFSPPARFAELRSDALLIGSDNPDAPGTTTEFHVASHFPHKQFVIIQFREIPDMNAAELLRGRGLFARRADLWPATPDEYLECDLIGLDVVDAESQTLLGTVKSVITGAAHDTIQLARPGSKDALIPFVKELVTTIDIDARRIEVTLPPGLLDL